MDLEGSNAQTTGIYHVFEMPIADNCWIRDRNFIEMLGSPIRGTKMIFEGLNPWALWHNNWRWRAKYIKMIDMISLWILLRCLWLHPSIYWLLDMHTATLFSRLPFSSTDVLLYLVALYSLVRLLNRLLRYFLRSRSPFDDLPGPRPVSWVMGKILLAKDVHVDWYSRQLDL